MYRRDGGLEVQASRFSIIAPPGNDDSDEEGQGWETAKGKKVKKLNHESADGKQNEAGPVTGKPSKASLKNAKRRAKKKAMKGNESHEDFNEWVDKDQKTSDEAFEQDLKEALLRSMVDAEREEKLMKEELIKLEQQQQMATKHAKKGVKMSLQEFFQSDIAVSPVAGLSSPHNTTASGPDNAVSNASRFFDEIESEVKSELIKEKMKIRHNPNSQKTGNKKSQSEPARAAQLLDELEKKDATIREQALMIEKIENEMREVKVRNQVLCKMLSKGEFSTKHELLEQIEEMISDKTQLSQEIERLASELEQEKSRNKSLQNDLNKLQHAKQH